MHVPLAYPLLAPVFDLEMAGPPDAAHRGPDEAEAAGMLGRLNTLCKELAARGRPSIVAAYFAATLWLAPIASGGRATLR